MDTNQLKQAAADAAIAMVEDGMVVGLGSGSTSELALQTLGRRVREGLRITGVPTSKRIADLARGLAIPLAAEDDLRIDLDIDGADEVEQGSLNLIKGRGGALLREKIVAASSAIFIVIVDDSKIVNRLGEKCAVPVEVMPFGWRSTSRKIAALSSEPRIRQQPDGQPFFTDSGNHILDCSFGAIGDPVSLAARLCTIPGVVEHGLFLGMASRVLVAAPEGLTTLTRAS